MAKNANGKFVLKALLLTENNGKILVQFVRNGKKGRLYRPLGGHVEFGEKSEGTIKREIREEVDSSIKDLKFVGFIENIYRSETRLHHEIDFIYEGKLSNEKLFENEIFDRDEDGRKEKAYWIEKSLFKEEKIKIVPRNILKYL